jgi:hypothetical protein
MYGRRLPPPIAAYRNFGPVVRAVESAQMTWPGANVKSSE